MSVEIWVAIIGSLGTLLGVIITVNHNDKKSAARAKEQTDLTLYRIGELEKKQDRYNHLQERMCKVEKSMAEMKSDIHAIDNRIGDLHNQ